MPLFLVGVAVAEDSVVEEIAGLEVVVGIKDLDDNFELVVGFVEIGGMVEVILLVIVETIVDLAVLVVVLQVAAIFLLLHEAETV